MDVFKGQELLHFELYCPEKLGCLLFEVTFHVECAKITSLRETFRYFNSERKILTSPN